MDKTAGGTALAAEDEGVDEGGEGCDRGVRRRVSFQPPALHLPAEFADSASIWWVGTAITRQQILF